MEEIRVSKIIDLGLLVQEPLIFKGLDKKTYKIPGEISTKLVVKLSKYAQDVAKLGNNEEEALEKMKEMVMEILNLDTSKNVDMDYMNQYFDDIRVLKAIIQATMEHIRNIAQDPNSNSLKSE